MVGELIGGLLFEALIGRGLGRVGMASRVLRALNTRNIGTLRRRIGTIRRETRAQRTLEGGEGRRATHTEPESRQSTRIERGRPVPGLPGCRIGSLFCPFSYLEEEFDELFQIRENSDFAQYLCGPRQFDLYMGRSLRRTQTILTGNQIYAQYLREVPSDQWSELFRDATSRVGRENIDYRIIRVPGREPYRWPLDNGTPWVIHHDPPLGWVRAEGSHLWHPMPRSIHDQGHVWWRSLDRNVRSRIPEEMLNEVFESDIDITEL